MKIKDLLTVQRVNYLSNIRIRYDFNIEGLELFLYKNIDIYSQTVNGCYNLRVNRINGNCILDKYHVEEKLK